MKRKVRLLATNELISIAGGYIFSEYKKDEDSAKFLIGYTVMSTCILLYTTQYFTNLVYKSTNEPFNELYTAAISVVDIVINDIIAIKKQEQLTNVKDKTENLERFYFNINPRLLNEMAFLNSKEITNYSSPQTTNKLDILSNAFFKSYTNQERGFIQDVIGKAEMLNENPEPRSPNLTKIEIGTSVGMELSIKHILVFSFTQSQQSENQGYLDINTSFSKQLGLKIKEDVSKIQPLPDILFTQVLKTIKGFHENFLEDVKNNFDNWREKYTERGPLFFGAPRWQQFTAILAVASLIPTSLSLINCFKDDPTDKY